MAWSSSLLGSLVRPLARPVWNLRAANRRWLPVRCRAKDGSGSGGGAGLSLCCGSLLDAAFRLRLLPGVDELTAQGGATIGQLGDLFSAQLFTGEAEDHVKLIARNGSAHDIPRTFAGRRRNPALRAERLQLLLQSVCMGAARTRNANEDAENHAAHREPLVLCVIRPTLTSAYDSRGDRSPGAHGASAGQCCRGAQRRAQKRSAGVKGRGQVGRCGAPRAPTSISVCAMRSRPYSSTARTSMRCAPAPRSQG